jgi:hypothetical protein
LKEPGPVDRKPLYDIIQWDFEERLGMKKIYEKPTFVRKGKLSAIVSTISVIIVPPPG